MLCIWKAKPSPFKNFKVAAPPATLEVDTICAIFRKTVLLNKFIATVYVCYVRAKTSASLFMVLLTRFYGNVFGPVSQKDTAFSKHLPLNSSLPFAIPSVQVLMRATVSNTMWSTRPISARKATPCILIHCFCVFQKLLVYNAVKSSLFRDIK